jgi:hypothetical protein
MAIPLLPSGLSIRKIGSSVFGGGGGAPNVQGTSQEKQQFVEQTKQFVETQRQNQTVIANMQQQFQNFQNQLNALSKSINNIAKLLQQDTLTEQQLLRQEQEQENRYAQRKIRLGRESRLEERIQTAVMGPVQAAASKIESVFGGVGRALQTLFFGFLGIQALKSIRAYAEGDEKELGSIKDLVIKNVGFVLGSFLAIKGGFFLIKTALKKLIGGVTSFLFTGISQIFKFSASKIGAMVGGIAAGIGGMGGKKPPAAPSPSGAATATPPTAAKGGTPPTSGGGFWSNMKNMGGNLLKGGGKLLGGAAVTAGLDVAFGEDPTKAAVGGLTGAGAAAAVSKLPLPPLLKFPLAIGAGIFGQQQGKNLMGGEESGGGFDIGKMFNFGNNESNAQAQQPQANKQPPPVSTPTQTMTGKPSADVSSSTQMSPMAMKPASTESVSSKVEPQNNMFPDTMDFKLFAQDTKVKSFQEDTASTNQPKESMKPLEENKMNPAQITSPPTTQEAGNVESSNIFNISKNVSFDFINPSKEKMKSPETIAPLEEPKPNVIVTSPQTQQPSSSGQMPATPTDAPLIASSNPDNFYVLYSKLNYNVVT